ncbi:unnamed protein product [Owenia fusiformis]|nr:unnamed protein product [Owenia fusiformis]
MQPNGRYEISYQVMTPTNSTQMPNVTSSKPFYWADGSTGFDNAPDDVPMCGFSNEKCKEDEYRTIKIAIPSVGAAILALLFIISVLVTRKMKRLRIQSMPWKLNPEELIDSQTNIPRSTFQSIMSIHDNDSQVTLTQKGLFSDKGYTFAKVANYRGSQVAVKAIHKDVIHMTKDILIELHTMHSMKHVHVCYFVGASVEPNNIFVCWEYCSKGSLQDVLWNDNIKLDKNFKISLAFDVIKGLEYIHNTSIGYHGNLKSSNCVIDSYLSCKLTDFGLRHFRKGEAQVLEDEFTNTEHVKYKELFWTPPEDLAISLDEKTGTKPSDMYACGIIIKEILCRNGPYTEFEELTPKEIINKIREGSDKEFFRPLLPVEVRKEFPKCSSLAIKLWNELPETRPTVAEAHKIMKRCSSNTTVVDNMINTLEKYANNLEDIVIDRTKQLAEEKTRSEALLYRMLPRDVAEDLKKGISVKAESFDSVTIYFSDIVSFTSLCARSTPYQVVDMLNALYTIFDAKISKHDVYKVETIGDAYMLVSGLPKKNGEKHAQEIANCALEIRNAVLDFKVPHVPEYSLKIRIGLHTGPAVAGVVGLTMPRYCLFGDTVNTASRMESNSLPMMINMSESTFQLLQQTGSYLIQSRGQIDVKGKGCMNLYFLNEKVRRNNNSSIETRVISTQDDPARNHKKTIKHSIGENTRHTPNKYRSIPNNDDNIPNCDDKTPYNHDNTQNDDDNIRNYDDKTLKNDDTRSNHCQLNGGVVDGGDVEELLSSISDGERSTPVVVEI